MQQNWHQNVLSFIYLSLYLCFSNFYMCIYIYVKYVVEIWTHYNIFDTVCICLRASCWHSIHFYISQTTIMKVNESTNKCNCESHYENDISDSVPSLWIFGLYNFLFSIATIKITTHAIMLMTLVLIMILIAYAVLRVSVDISNSIKFRGETRNLEKNQKLLLSSVHNRHLSWFNCFMYKRCIIYLDLVTGLVNKWIESK